MADDVARSILHFAKRDVADSERARETDQIRQLEANVVRISKVPINEDGHAVNEQVTFMMFSKLADGEMCFVDMCACRHVNGFIKIARLGCLRGLASHFDKKVFLQPTGGDGVYAEFKPIQFEWRATRPKPGHTTERVMIRMRYPNLDERDADLVPMQRILDFVDCMDRNPVGHDDEQDTDTDEDDEAV